MNTGGLATYRYLLRSMAIAFHGDSVVLLAARRTARQRFDEGKKLASDSTAAIEGLQEARNVGDFLRRNLVQGVKTDKDDCYRTHDSHLTNNRSTNPRRSGKGRQHHHQKSSSPPHFLPQNPSKTHTIIMNISH
jgi:hypothetical protein